MAGQPGEVSFKLEIVGDRNNSLRLREVAVNRVESKGRRVVGTRDTSESIKWVKKRLKERLPEVSSHLNYPLIL